MSFQMLLILALLSMTGCAVAATVLILMLYVRNERRQQARFKQARSDVADMTILFQTMRDVIAQQKTLAHNFNKEMDKKMALVKQVMAASMQKNERLYERQCELEAELRAARKRLSGLQRQFNVAHQRAAELAPTPDEGGLDGGPDAAPVEVAEHAVSEAVPGEEEDAAPSLFQEETSEPAPEHAAALEQALLGDWAAIDLTRVEEPEEEAPEEAPPEAPEDADAAREAFRTLLNLEPEPEKETVAGSAAQTPDAGGGNGKKDLGILEQRVAEYDAAGMSVAEIAHELGIGKGEVRLMLSLVKQRRQ